MTAPTCEVEGCCESAQNQYRRKDGSIAYRKSQAVREWYNVENGWICAKHHFAYIRFMNGVKTAKEMNDLSARRKGYKDFNERRKAWHPELRHKKDYCENQDGRLGFKCNVSIVDPIMLELDHADGNPYNSDPSNLQTLCCNCHRYKTIRNGDHVSAGRRQMKRRMAS